MKFPTLTTNRLCAGAFALFLVTLPAAPLMGQEPETEAPDTEKPETDKPKSDPHLKAWPALEDKAGTSKAVQRLVKARTDVMGAEAAKALTEIGASCAPLLIKELAKTRDDDAADRITAVLREITGPLHTRLWAQEFEHKKPNVRRFALAWVARTPDPGVRKQAEAAFATSQSKKSRWEPRDRYLAALCCASAGSEAGLDDLIKVARTRWGDRLEDLSLAMPALRSDALTKKIIETVSSDKRQDKVDCLRLLSLCGTKEAVAYVKPLLDSTDGSLLVAAINTCRGIIDGDAPLGKLSTFAAIEMAKEWKAKL